MDYPYDYAYKFITVGDSGVGKSSLTLQYTDNKFSREHDITIGVEYSQKVVIANDNTRIKIQIWDTAGQETFKSITMSYYRGVACALIVYDISSRTSFNNAVTWLSDVKNLAPSTVVIALIGNKTDKEKYRKVTYEEGKFLADSNGLLFFESSAKQHDTVNEIFIQTVNAITELINSNKISINKNSGIKKFTDVSYPQVQSQCKTRSNRFKSNRFKWCSIL